MRDEIATVTLVGDTTRICRAIETMGGRSEELSIVEPDRARQAGDAITFAAHMVRRGEADGVIAGAVATTADTVRTYLQVIGPASANNIVSSFFLILLCDDDHPRKGAFAFADCGLVIEPTVEQLSQIAISSADSFAILTNEEPRVAMLSFSTLGSAKHSRVDRVVEATKVVRQSRPDLAVAGEMQFDAAFIPLVSAVKAPGSHVGGQANVLVFPNLEAGNIAYKVAQWIGRAVAIGPILQGLARPANDLSRGCSADDIYHMIAITSVQSATDVGRASIPPIRPAPAKLRRWTTDC